jgi:hypothetical protein
MKMDELEMTTAEGEGVWGNQKYHVALKIRSRTYYDSSRKSSKKVLSYLFTFGAQSISISDRRIFQSEAQRRLFLKKSFSELIVQEIPESGRRWTKLTSPVESIVGHKVSAVTFVEDYFQLELPPHKFNIYNWPHLSLGGEVLRFSDREYRAALSAYAGKQVSGFDEYLDRGLTLEFSDGSSISVPVKVDADFLCPEVAELWGSNICWYTWRANEEPFF